MKNYSFLFFFLILTSSALGQRAPKKTIIIDPGHGGNDPGTLVAFDDEIIKEKEIALKVAKIVQRKLFEEYNVYLTRSNDVYLSPHKRAEIAEIVSAELFISIHVNSHNNKDYGGFEIFYLDNKKDAALSRVEREENKAHKWTQEDKILMDLVVSKTAGESKKFSKILHKKLQTKIKPYGMRDRGVKQGLFYVLVFAKRPGALIEMGFLSNNQDAQNLMNKKFQQDYAMAIVEAIKDYTDPIK